MRRSKLVKERHLIQLSLGGLSKLSCTCRSFDMPQSLAPCTLMLYPKASRRHVSYTAGNGRATLRLFPQDLGLVERRTNSTSSRSAPVHEGSFAIRRVDSTGQRYDELSRNERPTYAATNLRQRDNHFRPPLFGGRETRREVTRDERRSGRSNSLDKSLDHISSRKKAKDDKSSRRSEKFAMSEDEIEVSAEQMEKFNRDQKRKERAAHRNSKKITPIMLPPFISVANLASALRVPMDQFLSKLAELGFEDVQGDHVFDAENASLVAVEYNFEPIVDTSERDDLKAAVLQADTSSLPPRPPVVTIMGHVDHGKTTLLDFLRKSSVAASEHGGITQHIGAFVVAMPSGRHITFLDTPGHAAFLSMRQRGANVTDLVVLVVAADDSVKPQTVEAIRHSKAANVPIIVAISKVDKEGVDIQRVKSDLARHGVEVEDFGGDVQAIEVSGKTGEGMEDLEEAISALAEVLDTRADDAGVVEGWVLEASTKVQGRVATVLVRKGTLRHGTVIVAGRTWAKVRNLRNEAGEIVTKAHPGTPVEVEGWRDQPLAGDEVLEAVDEQKATSVVAFRDARAERVQAGIDMEAINQARKAETDRREREREAAAEAEAMKGEDEPNRDKTKTTKDLQADAADAELRSVDLYFLIKGDVSGSVEAIIGALESLPLRKDPVNIKILHSGIGAINESDVDRIATVSKGQGYLISFNQAIAPEIQRQADQAQVRILNESIIYKVIDTVVSVIEDHLPPIINTRVVGEAEIAQIFDIRGEKKRMFRVAGCKVRNGTLTRGQKVRVQRGIPQHGDEGLSVYDGRISSLRSHKKEVSEIRKGSDCGVGFEDWQDFQAGDSLQAYEASHEKRRLMRNR